MIKKKVLVAMSGGVDSSVAAALLVRAGYDTSGAFMVNYDDPCSAQSCWRGDYQDALRVAAKLGIKLLRLDFTKEYDKMVLSYLYREYEAGRTPNPDVMCNKFVKFGVWLDKARELGFDYLATGHYATIKTKKRKNISTHQLRISRDANKDQTYFLHQLTQEQLQYVLFPVGRYNKKKVRKLAEHFSLPNSDKEESMGICFIGEVPMKEFLEKRIKPRPGKIVTSEGKEVGEHKGLAFYTIGERGIGLGSLGGRPLYVVEKRMNSNELVVGYEDDPLLFKKEIKVGDVNWIAGQEPKLPLKCEVRLRHRQQLQKCMIFRPANNCHSRESGNPCTHCHSHENGNPPSPNSPVIIRFTDPQRAVTPGQFAVFYRKGECLGGGVIL